MNGQFSQSNEDRIKSLERFVDWAKALGVVTGLVASLVSALFFQFTDRVQVVEVKIDQAAKALDALGDVHSLSRRFEDLERSYQGLLEQLVPVRKGDHWKMSYCSQRPSEKPEVRLYWLQLQISFAEL